MEPEAPAVIGRGFLLPMTIVLQCNKRLEVARCFHSDIVQVCYEIIDRLESYARHIHRYNCYIAWALGHERGR